MAAHAETKFRFRQKLTWYYQYSVTDHQNQKLIVYEIQENNLTNYSGDAEYGLSEFFSEHL